jgi:hypothetical protein
MSGWLWSGLGFGEWLVSVTAQTAAGFALIVIVLTPLAGRIKRLYKRQTDPTTPGGAGSRIVAGREVHDILADVTAPPSPLVKVEWEGK